METGLHSVRFGMLAALMQHRFLVVLILLAMMFNTSWRGQSSFCILEDAEIACEFDAESIVEPLEIKVGSCGRVSLQLV